MLISNYSYINQRAGHNHSGITNPVWMFKPDTMRQYYLCRDGSNIAYTDTDNFPVGTQPPYSYMMADSGINLTATTTVSGNGYYSNSNLAGGINVNSSLNGTGTINGDISAIAAVISALSGLGTLNASIIGKLEAASSLLGQGDIIAAIGAIKSAVAALTGNGTLNGNGQTVVSITSNLNGTGTLTFTSDIIGILQGVSNLAGSNTTAANIVGAWYMSSGLNGTSSLSDSLTAVANLVSSLVSNSVLSAAPYSTGTISANISVSASDPLSPENLAAALWNSLAVLYNNPGTMGELLNSSGSAADPWLTPLPGSYTPGSAGDIIGNLASNVWEEGKLSHVTPDTMGKVVNDLEKLIKQVKALTSANL